MNVACACPPEERDFLRSWPATVVLWRIPEAAFLLAFFVPTSIRSWMWAVSLTWCGLSCLANARRCGRRHCYLTGPFFLLGALAMVLTQAAPTVFPAATPSWIAVSEIAGALVLIFLPEYFFGRYARPAQVLSSGG